jgi:hypothetical protein
MEARLLAKAVVFKRDESTQIIAQNLRKIPCNLRKLNLTSCLRQCPVKYQRGKREQECFPCLKADK